MNFKIHRGTREIGGTCIEVWTENTRILLDFGMPLVEKDGTEFDFSVYKSMSPEELVLAGILPDIEGLYSEPVGQISGVIISHAHQDHFGLTRFINKNVGYFMGEATHRIIELNNIFSRQDLFLEKVTYFEREKTFRIGDFSITPYWADHSAFDAYSFLIEANGQRIFYSGDFRSHGRKAKAFRWFTHNAPQNVDYLLLEGTSVGNGDNNPFKTESEIEDDFAEVFRQSERINLVLTSGQNIDRLVSIYNACVKAGKILVVDVYVAKILKEMFSFAKIPHPSSDYPDIRVIFPYYTSKALVKSGYKDILFAFKEYKITKKEISDHPGQIVMLTRSSMIKDLEKISLDGGNVIFSMWEGYLEKPDTKRLLDYLNGCNFALYKIHTSGHADIDALKKMVDAVKPKNIVPIHTFSAKEFQPLFEQPVLDLKDGETVTI